ncbi:translocase [Catenulispora rubra]|uniref:translocase n=1 Tax=Catenulispora rubra TaxID=280293 RepID=UPI0018920B45|nr:translocase [Catenulispora rubra]
MFMRLIEIGLIVVAAWALFGRHRLPDSVRSIRKSARIMKSEMQAAADDVELPEAKVIPGTIVEGGAARADNAQN